MNSIRASLLLSSLAMLLVAASPSAHAGLGKLVVKGMAVGAGAAVGHKVANAAMNSTADAKAKADKKKQEQAIPNQPLPAPAAPQAPAAQAAPALPAPSVAKK